MNIKERLSQRIWLNDIHEINHGLDGDDLKKQELFSLLQDTDKNIAFRAAWIMSHFSEKANEWLSRKQDELIDEVLICQHIGKRRLLLAILDKQPLDRCPTDNCRTDFLNFCLERVPSGREPSGIQSLCIKIAYKLCRPFPELTQELRTLLEMMEDELPPSIQAVRKRVLLKIRKIS